MSKKTKKSYLSFDALSLGYSDLLATMENLEEDFASLVYPPYNLKKDDPDTYAVELQLAGYKRGDLHAYMEHDTLVIEATGPATTEPEADDEFSYEGIFSGGKFKCKFLIHPRLKFVEALYEQGIVTFYFDDTFKDTDPVYNLPILTPEEKEAARLSAKAVVVEYDSTGAPVNVYEDIPVAENAIVVNADVEDKPTVEVVLPDVLPQIVEVSLSNVVETPDVAAAEPQATVVVTPATAEVISDDVHVEVIKTEEGKSDIVVAIPVEVKDELESKGIDIVEAVTTAIESSELPAPELPVVDPGVVTEMPVMASPTDTVPAIAVQVPEEVPQIVQVVVADPVGDAPPVVTLEPVAADIPADQLVTPIVTAEGSPDMVLTITPEDHQKLEDAGVDLNAVTEAIVNVDPVVVTVDTPVVVDEAPVLEPVVEAPVEVVPEPVAEVVADPVVEAPVEVVAEPAVEAPVLDLPPADAPVAIAVVDEDVSDKPTVAVEMPNPLPENVVADVQVIAPAGDTANAEPQVVVSLSEAPAEPVAPDATVVTVETPVEQPNLAILVPADVQAVLDEHGVDVQAVVADAVVEANVEVVVAEPVVDAPVAEVVAEPTVTAVVDSANVESPTVAVTMPEVLPQVVEVSVESVQPEVDAASAQPQVVLTVSDATEGTSTADVETSVIKTEDGSADVVVAVPTETVAALEAVGVDVHEAVAAAVEQAQPESPPVVELPPAEVPVEPVVVQVETPSDQPNLEVSVPPVLPPVVSVDMVDGGLVVSTEVAADIPVGSEVLPVETPEGQANVMVVVSPELTASNVDVQAVVTDALAQAQVEVITETPTVEVPVESAPEEGSPS